MHDPYQAPQAQLSRAPEKRSWIHFGARAVLGALALPAFFIIFGAATGRAFPDFILRGESLAWFAGGGLASAALLIPIEKRWPRLSLAMAPVLAAALILTLTYLDYLT
jgi:hypothetical protein